MFKLFEWRISNLQWLNGWLNTLIFVILRYVDFKVKHVYIKNQ